MFILDALIKCMESSKSPNRMGELENGVVHGQRNRIAVQQFVTQSIPLLSFSPISLAKTSLDSDLFVL